VGVAGALKCLDTLMAMHARWPNLMSLLLGAVAIRGYHTYLWRATDFKLFAVQCQLPLDSCSADDEK